MDVFILLNLVSHKRKSRRLVEMTIQQARTGGRQSGGRRLGASGVVPCSPSSLQK